MRESLKRMFWVFTVQAALMILLVTCERWLAAWLASIIAVCALFFPFVAHFAVLDRSVCFAGWPRILRAGTFTFASLLLTFAGFIVVGAATDIITLSLRP
jgi:hypothetical protein